LNKKLYQLQNTDISPYQNDFVQSIMDIVFFRSLLFFLIGRELKIKFSGVSFGILWLFLQPIIFGVLLGFVFSIIVKVPIDSMPYPALIMTGLPFYIFFTGHLGWSIDSLRGNCHLLTKVYFPKIFVVLVPLVISAIEFFCLLVVSVLTLILFDVDIEGQYYLVFIPVFCAISFVLGLSVFVVVLNFWFRTVQQTIPFFFQIVLYASPIIYPVALVPEVLQTLYWLNPFVGLIEGFRYFLIGGEVKLAWLLYSFGISFILPIISFWIFFRISSDIGDYL